MQTLETIQAIVDQIKYKDWEFRLGLTGKVPWLQVRFREPCMYTGNVELQSCRKWMLSYHMTDSEIVRTALKAVIAAVEHEAYESFRYKGVQIFHPHHDLDALVEFAKKKRMSLRPLNEVQA